MPPRWTLDKKILLGVSGGIAAYKTPELVRTWIKSGAEVEIILTDTAARLVSPLTLSTLSKRRAWRDEDLTSDEHGWTIPHITLGGWADALVVAPCTANVLRMAASGDSGTLLGAAMLACHAPKIFFPAMNSHMWANPAAKANAQLLRERGCRVIDPDSGALACGYEGEGRLPSIETIVDETWFSLCPLRDLEGKKVLVTAGPTREYIDPVRFISNPSSGRMGYALASEARYRGGDVTLVSGPVSLRAPSGVKIINVTTAREMLDACMAELAGADLIIKAAAVGDYRAVNYSGQKIKRASGPMTLELAQNDDIAHAIGRAKSPGQILVGFAAETENIRENALKKIEAKRLDMVVANNVSDGAGFGSPFSDVEIHFAGGRGLSPVYVSGDKWEAASGILDAAVTLFRMK
ncbi:MAG: bifunctional phosphopantothenoylcysteine decarboxylase/phosphopantothenate--cysteine ligase CoaBC [Synergistaceae bacterium]|jgi:phosphopantothenoylcysteine decarboxylase/phosphopantothenate--cysteine ligase|nr:bifunctional phosphopantothenoylcysteine decarboxylase/phosphopantothenate--cysteine ligase CoaBC [Synergistaceae bacterium]